MDVEHTKQIRKVWLSENTIDRFQQLLIFMKKDFAAENNGTHGQSVDSFEQEMLEQTNTFRKSACAGNLIEDETLHKAAQKLAHAKANGNATTYSDSFNEINYELDTGDPSKITGRATLNFLLFSID